MHRWLCFVLFRLFPFLPFRTQDEVTGFDPKFVSIKVKGRFCTFLVRRGILASHPRSPEIFVCRADSLPILLWRKCVGLCLDTGDTNSTGIPRLCLNVCRPRPDPKSSNTRPVRMSNERHRLRITQSAGHTEAQTVADKAPTAGRCHEQVMCGICCSLSPPQEEKLVSTSFLMQIMT